jgi:hypothetical protein
MEMGKEKRKRKKKTQKTPVKKPVKTPQNWQSMSETHCQISAQHTCSKMWTLIRPKTEF